MTYINYNSKIKNIFNSVLSLNNCNVQLVWENIFKKSHSTTFILLNVYILEVNTFLKGGGGCGNRETTSCII